MSNLTRKTISARELRAKRQAEARAYVKAWEEAHWEKRFRDAGKPVPEVPERRVVQRIRVPDDPTAEGPPQKRYQWRERKGGRWLPI